MLYHLINSQLIIDKILISDASLTFNNKLLMKIERHVMENNYCVIQKNIIKQKRCYYL